MKTVLDPATRNELISRVNTISDSSKPQWGRMNVYQMLKHCVLADEMYMGKKQYKRVFLGRLLGKIMLKKMLNEAPMQRNAPTSPFFIISEVSGDVAAERDKWIAVINDYETLSDADFIHWFFGKMTKEQVGQFAYKHIDHHLRQFGA
ncbi:MAG: DUF1569 domain-containing protein [Mucilaginibacter sp.]|uniref:DUF1569 domain-containing protein n=1 Tax=Mucilaginibacter sp. TaxID=1882438 RepID=UPI003262F8AA